MTTTAGDGKPEEPGNPGNTDAPRPSREATPQRADGCAPIASYALLADLGATALVATDGAIDWFAAPEMDSPPIYAGLLDPYDGGSIVLQPAVPFDVDRCYVEGSMVLQTTFITESGRVRVTDALNRGPMGRLPWSELARRVDVLDGSVPMRWSVQPGHMLAQARPWCWWEQGVARLLVGEDQLAVVVDGVGEPEVGAHGLHGEFLAEGEDPALLAVVVSHREPVIVPTARDLYNRLECTIEHWHRWSGQIDADGPGRKLAVRSALTIKALSSEATGGIAAAATTSLPEQIGGEGNFDYRFCWIRDSSFAVDAMHWLGLSEEVHASVLWLLHVAAQRGTDLRTFYAMDGSVVPSRMRQVDIPGYRGTRPVNVGNQAADQTQLGNFGDLIDGVWGHIQRGGRLNPEAADVLARLADRTCELWRVPDSGIWELGEQQHYTISKIGCWVALDRAIRMAEGGDLVSLHVDRWRAERAEIRAWVNENCWSQSKGSYTFHADTEDLDAATLLAARTGFCDSDDQRLAGTVDAIRAELSAGGCLLYRYSGQQGVEGAFVACSGWLVEALVHLGRIEQAREVFADLAARANDVGLYSEEIDPATGAFRGNMPQVLSHLAVIGAAAALMRAGAS